VRGGFGLKRDKRRNRRAPAAVAECPANQGGTVSLFVSILVRYPEVASVTYRRESHCLRLSVLVRSGLPEERVAALRERIGKSIQAYVRLVDRETRVFDLAVKARQGVSVVEMWRDIDSLTQNELSLILTVVREFFGDELVVDSLPHVESEDLAVQEELIEEMLDDLRDFRQQPNLIAFREEGRVLVFNQ
jgi:hypothetical protein